MNGCTGRRREGGRVGDVTNVAYISVARLHVWSSGFLRRRSDGMELASTLTPGPCSEYQRLQIGSENSFFRNAVGTNSALKALRDALYKSTTTTTVYYV